MLSFHKYTGDKACFTTCLSIDNKVVENNKALRIDLAVLMHEFNQYQHSEGFRSAID